MGDSDRFHVHLGYRNSSLVFYYTPFDAQGCLYLYCLLCSAAMNTAC